MAIISISGYAGSGKDTVGKIIQWLTALEYYPNRTPILFEDFMGKYAGLSTSITPTFHVDSPRVYIIKKWAGKLKEVASILSGIPIGKFEDQQFKLTDMDECWGKWKYNGKVSGTDVLPIYGNDPTHEPMTVREFLQRLGTEAMRNGLHENTWVNALMADYKPVTLKWDSDGNTTLQSFPNWIITDTRFPNELDAVMKHHGITIRVVRTGGKPVNQHPSENSLDDAKFNHVIENDSTMESLIEKVREILKQEKIIS